MNTEKIDLLNTAVLKLLKSKSPEEATSLLQLHPELLMDEADILIGYYIDQAREQHNDEVVQLFSFHRQTLQFVRSQQEASQSDIPAHFQALIDHAKAAETRYQQGGGVPALNDAIAAWEQILTDSEFADADAKLRLGILNDSAGSFMRRYWATGILADLDKALSCWKDLTRNVSPDFPDLPIYLNNLGIGLSARYRHTGSLADLNDSIANARQAVELTPEGSPDLIMFLNNLGLFLSYRYQHTSSLSDLDESIANIRQAIELTPEDSSNLLALLNNLGMFLLNRYQQTGSLSDLDESIANARQAVQLSPEGSPDLPSFLNNLGNSLSDSYQRTGELSDLDDSMASARLAVELSQVGDHNLPKYLNNLSSRLSSHYQRTGELSDLDQSIANTLLAVELTPEKSPDLPMYFSSLGGHLSDRYQRTGELSDLNDSIANALKAVELTPAGVLDLPGRLNSLSSSLSECYQRTGLLSDLDESIANARQAVELTPEGSPDLPGLLNNLGNHLSDHYQRTGSLAELDESIANTRLAVELTPEGPPSLPGRLNNLGNRLSNRYQRTCELSDLDESIASARKAVELTQLGDPSLPTLLNNLSNSLLSRYQCTDSLADLDDSVANVLKAVELTPEGAPNMPIYLNNLSNSLSNRYQLTGSLSDLDASIANTRKAVKLTPAGAPKLPTLLNNLAGFLSYRCQHTGDLADLQQGIAAYQRAAQQGLEVNIEKSLTSARNWLYWAFGREAWVEVVQAYDYVFKASTQLVQTQLSRQHQTLWLKQSQGLAAHTAYALAQQNQLTQAVVTLERGLAQLLSDALARNRAELEQLQTLGHSNLYESYQQALNDWHEAQQLANRLEQPTAEPSEQIVHRHRAAREQLDNTIAAIRQIEGYADFLAAPEFADIRAAVNQTRLVYIAATEAGGLALIVADNDAITPVWLPELTSATLADLFGSVEPPYRGYLRAYDNWRRDTNDETHRTEWFAALEQTTQLLWQRIMAPIIEVLPESAAITLIPVGRLGLLPLHAAWTPDSTAPTGKRYALDVLTINYAPNARAVRAAQRVANRISADSLLVIEEPLPVTANQLPSARYETQTVISTFKQPEVLKNHAATRAAVLTALPDHNVLHFCCHGLADLEEPLQSGLMMANDELLTVKDILDLRHNGVRLATLSACETGLAGTKLPDEVVSLPAWLIQAGVAGVAASLWAVNDFSTMMLMAYFYDRWRIDQLQPAAALRQAQIWIRDTTNAQKNAYFKQRLSEPTSTVPNETKMAQIMLKEPTDREFEHPYYWAAFGLVGV